jgi:acyl-CoA synthetase (AMP-forming)/AMP-acid ligase II
MTKNLVTRDFIHSNFKLHNNNKIFNKQDIVEMICFWKIILWEKYSVRPGMKIGIAMQDVDPYHVSLIFAASELALELVQLDHPVNKFTIDKTKAALFAPIDIGIVDHALQQDELHQTMMQRYCRCLIDSSDFDQYTIKDHALYSSVANTIFCKQNSVLLWASTSGTTSESKPVPYTQKYIANLSIRNSIIFNHTTDSKVMHTRNMHHASSLLIHFLPTIFACSEHWSKYVDYNHNDQMSEFVDLLFAYKINFCMLFNIYHITNLFNALKKKKLKFDHDIDFNISGFLLEKSLLAYVKEHNLSIVSTFGSIDTGVPVFVNCLRPDTDESSMTPGLIGYFPKDNFYKLKLVNNQVELACDHWAESKILNDKIEERDGLYFYLQRDSIITMKNFSFDLHIFTNYVKLLVGYSDISVIVDHQNDCLYLVIWDRDTECTLDGINKKIHHSEFSNCIFTKLKCLHKQDFVVDTKVSVDQLRGYLSYCDTN